MVDECGYLSWDYLAHYCFTQSLSRGVKLSQAMGNIGDLSSIVEEISKLKTDTEHLQWIAPNYSRALAAAKRLLQHLLSVFDQSVTTQNNFLPLSLLSSSIFLPFLLFASANVGISSMTNKAQVSRNPSKLGSFMYVIFLSMQHILFHTSVPSSFMWPYVQFCPKKLLSRAMQVA
jgi:hypothetical protein